MKVLFKLTNIDKVAFKLSEDLKLINIVLGIGTHSSKHPCPYGECYRDDDGFWVKGQDRTIRNILEHHSKWMKRSRKSAAFC